MTELRYVAFPASAADDYPAHVKRTFKDEQGRRVHQYIAICSSGGVDNDAMAEKIAEALSSVEGLRERVKFTESYEQLRLLNADMLAALKLAAPHVCSLLCASVKKTADEWKHSEECCAITDALAKAEAQP